MRLTFEVRKNKNCLPRGSFSCYEVEQERAWSRLRKQLHHIYADLITISYIYSKFVLNVQRPLFFDLSLKDIEDCLPKNA